LVRGPIEMIAQFFIQLGVRLRSAKQRT